MGDAKAGPVRLSFNHQLRVEFHGATVTSDAGLLLPRELDARLGLCRLIERASQHAGSAGRTPQRGRLLTYSEWADWLAGGLRLAQEHKRDEKMGPYRKFQPRFLARAPTYLLLREMSAYYRFS